MHYSNKKSKRIRYTKLSNSRINNKLIYVHYWQDEMMITQDENDQKLTHTQKVFAAHAGAGI